MEVTNLYTTLSNGRTHIAADTQYLGSVDSYNNLFTQCVSRLFGFSMTVDFDGKNLCVNKNSYTKLLIRAGRNVKRQRLESDRLFEAVVGDPQ